MTVHEVAEYLSLSEVQVRLLRRQGKLKAQGSGRIWIYDRASVEEYRELRDRQKQKTDTPVVSDGQTLSLEDKKAEIIRLRQQGIFYPEIGRRVGLSKQRCQQIYKKATAPLLGTETEHHELEDLADVDLLELDLLDLEAYEHK